MQLGFVSAIFGDLDLNQVLKFAGDEQYDCVEIMCWPVGKADRKYAGVTHIDCDGLTQAKADDLGGLREKHKVQFSGLGYYPNPLSGDEAEAAVAIEHLKKVIAAAPLFGLKNVNTFIGSDHRLHLDQNFEKFRKVWPDIIRFAEDRGVFIGIENCPMLFSLDEWPSGKNMAYAPATWRRMFEAIPSKHFGLNFDPSHLVWQMVDYVRPVYEFRDRLFHTHAKDMRVEQSLLNERGIMGFGWSTPKIPGLGDVNWNRWISALTDIGYDGAVCVEVEDEAFRETLEARKHSLRISRNVLRPLIG